MDQFFPCRIVVSLATFPFRMCTVKPDFMYRAIFSQYFKLLKDYKARYLGEGAVDPNMKLFYEEKVGKEEA